MDSDDCEVCPGTEAPPFPSPAATMFLTAGSRQSGFTAHLSNFRIQRDFCFISVTSSKLLSSVIPSSLNNETLSWKIN